jgi:hypothetical protein|tara:strand:+ start:516 stop:710 length:195 start_codon:yes stop_codon:yes gene_type:complete
MAIFVYDKNKKKVVPIEKATNKVELKSNNCADYVNMRKTWSGQTQVEFSSTTMEQDIADRNKGR